MEDSLKVIESVKYAATVTLKPNLYRLDATEQFDKTYHEIYIHMMNLCSKFTCIAELTKNYNVHYHLTCQFYIKPGKSKNVMKQFTDSFRKSKYFGFVQIRQIDNDESWNDYILKSLKDTKDLIDRPPIIKFDHLHDKLTEYQLTNLIQDFSYKENPFDE